MQGSAKRNFIMFKQLCGPNALKRVVLVTTMWDRVSEGEGVDGEKVLVDTPDFWGWMLSKGSSCHRHNNTKSSAREIINLLANHNGPVATDLQRQLVDEHRSLDQTSAGQQLDAEMRKQKEKLEREHNEMDRQMRIAVWQRDCEAEQLLREERDKYTIKIKKVEEDTNKLRSTMEKLLADRDRRVALQKKEMEELLADRDQRVALKEREMEELLADRDRRIALKEKELEKQKAAYAEALRRSGSRAKQLEKERDKRKKERALDELDKLGRAKETAQALNAEVRGRAHKPGRYWKYGYG
jgi:hypothetical protein